MEQNDQIGATLEQYEHPGGRENVRIQRIIPALSYHEQSFSSKTYRPVRPFLPHLAVVDSSPMFILRLLLHLSACCWAAIYLATSALGQTPDTNGVQNFLDKDIEYPVAIFWGISVHVASLFILLLYVVLCFLARHLWIVVPNINQLCATRDIIKARISLLPAVVGPQQRLDPKPLRDLIDDSERYVPIQGGGMMTAGLGFTANITAAWRILHEAERHLAASGVTPRWSKSQAILLLARLQQMPGSPVKLKRDLQKLVAAQEPTSRIIPLVQEARAFVFEADDKEFAAVADARNKGMFLFLAAIFSVILVGWFFSNSLVLLFAGAVGGILSRLRKAVSQSNTPFNLGLEWTIIQLTPVVGALTGFFGLMIFEVLISFNIAGELFSEIRIEAPTGWTVVLAFVFGWSATLFDTFLERVEGRMRMSPEQRELNQQIETEAGLEERDEARKEIERLVKENEVLSARLSARDSTGLAAQEPKGDGG